MCHPVLNEEFKVHRTHDYLLNQLVIDYCTFFGADGAAVACRTYAGAGAYSSSSSEELLLLFLLLGMTIFFFFLFSAGARSLFFDSLRRRFFSYSRSATGSSFTFIFNLKGSLASDRSCRTFCTFFFTGVSGCFFGLLVEVPVSDSSPV